MSTSVEDLVTNSDTTGFSTFLIFLVRSQIMYESLEKTTGHARLESLVFILRCVLKIPNFSHYIYMYTLTYMYRYAYIYIHKSMYVSEDINTVFFCGREKADFSHLFFIES